MGLTVNEQLRLRGLMRLEIREADGRLVTVREHRNLICNIGVAQLSAATVWSAAQDQNDNMGDPLSPEVLYPIYGAVGSSSVAATANDVQLGNETARAVVANANSSGNQVLLTFFYPTTAVGWSITEVGVFVSGSQTATALPNTGLLLNHAVFAAVTKTTSQTATLLASFAF